jgi:hypothetical protein
MLFRRHSPAVSRVLTAVAAMIGALGVVDCTTLASGSRDGILSGTIASAAHSSRPRASLDDLLLDGADTYIGRLLADRDSTFERWPDRVERPLRVWVDSSSAIAGPQAGFPAAVREAFTQWSATGIPIRFAYVTHQRDADIRVRWTDHLERKTGSTTWRTDHFGWLTGSEITLATHISSGQELDARGMRAIALHEVGHALGLSHSTDAHDIMAPLVRVDGLSETDRNTIRLLYQYAAGHIQ